METDTADSYIAIIIDGDNSHILTWHFDESISWDRWPTLWYIVSLISVISSVPLWWDFIATPVGIDLQGLPAEGTDPTAKLEAPAHVHRLGEVNVHDNGAYNTSRQKLWRVIVCWPYFLPPSPLFPPTRPPPFSLCHGNGRLGMERHREQSNSCPQPTEEEVSLCVISYLWRGRFCYMTQLSKSGYFSAVIFKPIREASPLNFIGSISVMG